MTEKDIKDQRDDLARYATTIKDNVSYSKGTITGKEFQFKVIETKLTLNDNPIANNAEPGDVIGITAATNLPVLPEISARMEAVTLA